MDPRFAKKGVGGNMPWVYVPPWRLQLVEEKALVGPREPSPRKLPGTVLGIFKTLFLSYSSYTWHIISLRTTFLFNCSQPHPPPPPKSLPPNLLAGITCYNFSRQLKFSVHWIYSILFLKCPSYEELWKKYIKCLNSGVYKHGVYKQWD